MQNDQWLIAKEDRPFHPQEHGLFVVSSLYLLRNGIWDSILPEQRPSLYSLKAPNQMDYFRFLFESREC